MPKKIDAVPTRWSQVVLVCRKCSKKLDGGFGPEGETGLARALKSGLRRGDGARRVRVIETKCLGVCPKNAVVVLDGRSPQAVLTVPAGSTVEAVLARLLSPQP